MNSQAWRNGMCETTVLFHHAKSQTSVRNNWTATNAELSQNRVSKKWERWILFSQIPWNSFLWSGLNNPAVPDPPSDGGRTIFFGSDRPTSEATSVFSNFPLSADWPPSWADTPAGTAGTSGCWVYHTTYAMIMCLIHVINIHELYMRTFWISLKNQEGKCETPIFICVP